VTDLDIPDVGKPLLDMFVTNLKILRDRIGVWQHPVLFFAHGFEGILEQPWVVVTEEQKRALVHAFEEVVAP
jgi:hypothetical protein